MLLLLQYAASTDAAAGGEPAEAAEAAPGGEHLRLRNRAQDELGRPEMRGGSARYLPVLLTRVLLVSQPRKRSLLTVLLTVLLMVLLMVLLKPPEVVCPCVPPGRLVASLTRPARIPYGGRAGAFESAPPKEPSDA